jgi:hypothetical protein
MKIPEPIIPKEHGAWAVLFVPFLVGAGVAQGFSFRLILGAIAVLGAFMSYVPAQMVMRHHLGRPLPEGKLRQAWFWGSIYLGASIASSFPVVMQGYLLLIPLGILGVVAFAVNFFLTRNAPKTIAGDLVSVAGLTLSALLAYYTLKGALDTTALLLWVVNLLFFGGSVLYVHMKIRAASTRKESLEPGEKFSLGRFNLLYHIAAVGIAAGLVFVGALPALAILAFVPMAIHAFYGTLKLSGRVRFKNLGFLMLGHSVLFAFLVVGAQ